MRLYDGVPYDYFRTADDLIFTAGACPLDESGQVVAPGNIQAQSLRAVDNLITVLTTSGSDVEHLVKTTVYVASSDRGDLVRAWQTIEAQLGHAPSTLLGVAVLGYAGQLVEIEAVARVAR